MKEEVLRSIKISKNRIMKIKTINTKENHKDLKNKIVAAKIKTNIQNIPT